MPAFDVPNPAPIIDRQHPAAKILDTPCPVAPALPKDPSQRAKALLDMATGDKVPTATPAMARGVDSRLWEISDIVKVVEDWERKNERGEGA
jgi:hypothetical protein